MKYTLWSFVALALCFVSSCKNDKEGTTESGQPKSTYEFAASTDQDTARYIPLYLHDIPTDVNAQVTEQGQYGQISPPDMGRFEAQVLTKGIWTIEFYVDNNASRAQKMAGTGQWFQFYGDGSFKGGHWEHQTHSGVWYMNYTTAEPTLTIDSNVDNHDAWWEIQGVTGQQDAMAWRRVSESGFGPFRKRIVAKLMELTDLPTKKQFEGQFNF